MRFKKKISAFTLAEMLVVSAITAIIAALAFAIITIFTKNMRSIENNYSRSTERSLFADQLTVDFNRYPTIEFTALSRKLIFKNPLDSISYHWGDNWVQREGDTLLDIKTKLELYNRGNRVDAGATDAIKIRFGEVDNGDFIFISQIRDAFSYIEKDGD